MRIDEFVGSILDIRVTVGSNTMTCTSPVSVRVTSLQSAGGGQAGREALRRFLCHAGPVLVQKIELSRLQISSAFLMPAARRRDYSGSAA